jgi:hypothetical protein
MWEVPMVVGEPAVVLGDGHLLEQGYGWQDGSCFEGCDGRLGGCVDGAEVVLPVVVACDGRVTAFCQDWRRVAGSAAPVRTQSVLDRKCVGAHSSRRWSNHFAQVAYAPGPRQQWVGHERPQIR